MSVNDRPDTQLEGQLSIENMFEMPERLFAVSKIFTRARKEMSLAEQKTFVYALSELRFTEEAKSELVYLDKKTLARIVGIDVDDADHLSVNLHRAIKELPKNSFIEINKEDVGFYDSGVMITRLTMFKNRVRLKFEKEYLSLFTGLSKDYITMWSSDIFQMKSKRSVQFYEYLRQITDTRRKDNDVLLGVRALKEMFDIPMSGEGSYMRKDGHFDRLAFEKNVVDVLCNDLKGCKMINLVIQPDGKMYEKEKSGNRVAGYRFHWTFSAYPRVATAAEVEEIQEKVDKNPKILKVAKDIVDGTKKPKKHNRFNNFQQREYDFDEMERKLLQHETEVTAEHED